jgi:hypothetical protein
VEELDSSLSSSPLIFALSVGGVEDSRGSGGGQCDHYLSKMAVWGCSSINESAGDDYAC